LYLMGVHRINSLRYNLDIHEFLKWASLTNYDNI
jgi:hypothetical protein